jgi:glutathione synthase/RimK-type ligase-like ATP-grasp enzyme
VILLAGGALDPHLTRALRRAEARGIPARGLLVGPETWPTLTLGVPDGALILDREALRPTALWVRHDVFAALADPRPAVAARALDWYEALVGYAALNPALRVLNREALGRRVNKLAALGLAASLGLRVPRGVVTNDLGALRPRLGEGLVAKPLRGGGLCVSLHDALGEQPDEDTSAPSPAFVQERLRGPERRVTLVGDQAFTFELYTEALDHRATPDAPMTRVDDPPEEVLARLRALARALGLQLCAADLKQDAEGALVLLEMNAQPMYTAYDTACDGAITDAILDLLSGE